MKVALACSLAASVIIGFAGVASAQPTGADAAASPGWHFVHAFASQNPYLEPFDVASTGPADAWLSGESQTQIFTAAWNGQRWRTLPEPPGIPISVDQNVFSDDLEASSPTNVWALDEVNDTRNYALRWNGSAWTVYRVPYVLVRLAVLSPADVWAFGDGSRAYHFNGHAWRWVPAPRLSYPAVFAYAPDNIWLVGPRPARGLNLNPVQLVAHWNGHRWRVERRIPPAPAAEPHLNVIETTALGPRDIWATESYPVNLGSGMPRYGLILARWNGRRWVTEARDRSVYTQVGPISDGHGGLWLDVLSGPAQVDVALHYSGGRFSRYRLPAPRGYESGITGMVVIPGTRSVWAADDLTTTGSGDLTGGILRYVP
jgi:hypothetical protein